MFSFSRDFLRHVRIDSFAIVQIDVALRIFAFFEGGLIAEVLEHVRFVENAPALLPSLRERGEGDRLGGAEKTRLALTKLSGLGGDLCRYPWRITAPLIARARPVRVL